MNGIMNKPIVKEYSGLYSSHGKERIASVIVLQLLYSPPPHEPTPLPDEPRQPLGFAICNAFTSGDIQPHRVGKFKLSNDPHFEEKVRDIVGLYLNPPERALVLCVDEKSQIQALDRTAPILPCVPVCLSVRRTTTNATAPRPCSLRSISSTARSLAPVRIATAAGSSSDF